MQASIWGIVGNEEGMRLLVRKSVFKTNHILKKSEKLRSTKFLHFFKVIIDNLSITGLYNLVAGLVNLLPAGTNW